MRGQSWDDAWKWALRIGGLAIVIYETVFEHADRPSLLVLAAGMMGLDQVIKLRSKTKE